MQALAKQMTTRHDSICAGLPDSVLGGRVLIVGLGKSGLSCARFLTACGIEVAVTDSRSHPPGLDALREALPDVAVFMDGFAQTAFTQADCLVVSPGVSLREPLIIEALARGVGVLGDIELFARCADAPIVAITGSNGKSTVTTLLGEMAKRAKRDVRVGGNLGTPALELLDGTSPDLYILECSSFQLETTSNLNASVATLLNVSEDHMDRYIDLDEYLAAKEKIYQGAKTLVVNNDDARCVASVEKLAQGQNVLGFTLHQPQDGGFGVCYRDDEAWLCQGSQLLLPVTELRIPGEHNIANALAALALGTAIGLPMPAMLTALRDFSGLPHRSQWVAEHAGVVWYNDSKATNVGATLAALKGLPAKQIVLIAGGQGKAQDFTPLKNIVARRVSSVVLMGEDANVIEQALDSVAPIFRVKDMLEAVKMAGQQAQPGDAVVLSPACASFDMFSGYEERGDAYIAAVREQLS